MKRLHALTTFLTLSLLLLAACAGPTATPQVIVQTSVVRETQLVEQTQVVEVPVEVQVTAPADPVKLVVLTHWGEESLLTPMQAKFDEYMALNPHVTIEYQTVTFDQLLTKITTARAAGISPDVYHFYNLWMPEFVQGGLLAVPPEDVIADIRENYAPGSVEAVSFAGQIWGYPTEFNTYQLIYNKKLLSEAGFSEPPETLDELREMACAMKQVDASGTVTQAGFVVMPGWDSGVVHPFLSLLWSNGGEYISADGTQALFNSPEGLATLQLYTDMIADQCIDTSMTMAEFANGRAGMIIMANWWRATLQTTFPDGYENVGVAPIPHSAGGTSAALQYNWAFGVDNGSKNREEAWKLVQWLNSPSGEGQASPVGDYLTSALGAIPSRTSDQEALSDRLGDEFLQAFVASAASARPEPVVSGGQEVKTTLQVEIEAAWYGDKTPDQALADAAEEANRILGEE